MPNINSTYTDDDERRQHDERKGLLSSNHDHSASNTALDVSSSPLNNNEGGVISSDDSDAEFDPTAAVYGVERERYVVLIALCLINGVNTLLWMTYATIVTPTETFYGINSSDINTLNITYMAIYAGAFWLSGVLLPHTGLGWGLVLCGALNVVVVVLRLVTTWDDDPSYGMILASNLVGGLCQVVILCAPPMCSNQWFALEERNFATGMGVAAQVFGGALGALLPAVLVSDGDKTQFARLYWIQFACAGLGFIAALVAKKAPSKPPTAAAFKLDENVTRRSFHHDRIGGVGGSPTHSARQSAATVRSSTNSAAFTLKSSLSSPKRMKRYLRRAVRDILKTLAAIAKNWNFMLILLITGVVQGSLWTVASLLMQIVQPFGVSQSTVGWIGFGAQIAGGVGSTSIGGVLAHFTDYKPVLVWLIVFSAATGLAFPVVANIIGSDISVALSTVMTGVLYGGLCLFCIPQVPIVFELGVEVTFPLSEEVTSPLIMWTPSVFSLILVQALGYLLTDNPTQDRAIWTMYILGGIVFLSTGAAVALKLQYKRREYETRHAKATAGATVPETENGVAIGDAAAAPTGDQVPV